jgi:predicted P-loop ATPase
VKLSQVKHLHEAGFSLLFLYPREKRPIDTGWTKNPNRSWAELKAQFREEYNVGVRLGELSKIGKRGYLACIDVDIKDEAYQPKALTQLKELISGEKYPEVRSGSGNGSRHLYCVVKRPCKPVMLAEEKGKWSICLYSSGRQMALPPSIHPKGAPYVWIRPFDASSVPLFEIPQSASLTQTVQGNHETPFKAEEVNLWESKLGIPMIRMIEEGVPEGQRSEALLSASMAMARAGFTDNQILSVLSKETHLISEKVYENRHGRASVVEWLRKYALDKARFTTDPMRWFDNKPEFRKPNEKEIEKVTTEVKQEIAETLPDVDGKGKPHSTVRNTFHILEHFMGGQLVGFDDFANRAVFLKDTVYGGKKGQELADHDDLSLMHYIACHYRFEPSQDHCFKAHALMSKKYHFHPVKDYLNSLKWDGEPRLDTWLRSAFKASGPDEYLRAVSRKVLVAAVKRVFEPGCKFDYVLVLEGHQGKGKSTALKYLAGAPWFTDSLGDIQQKDVVDQMVGKWIIEMAELASIRKQDIEPVKAFLSRQVDRVRPPYGRRSMDFPRQSILIGSTNNAEYFSDETGNRRFWPVRVGSINRKWMRNNRDQIWAEALTRYNLGETTYLSPDLEEVAQAEQEERFEVDEWEGQIRKVVEDSKEKYFITTHLWRAINITNGSGHPSMSDSKRIGKIMYRLGFIRTTQRIEGNPAKCWMKNYKIREIK